MKTITPTDAVYFESRSSCVDEIERMQSIVERLPEVIASQIASVFCDSKVGACYIVTLKDSWLSIPARAKIRAGFIEHGGHNGLTIFGADGLELVDFGPWWPDEF